VSLDFKQFEMQAKKASYTNYMAMIFSNASIRLSYVLVHTPVTPDQVTLLSTFIGLMGAVMILHPTYYFRILGIVVWFVAYVMDFCDGEIARFKNMQSEFGHWFDEVTDRLKDVGLYTAITLLAFGQSSSLTAVLFGLLALGGTLLYSYAITYRFSSASQEKKGVSPDKFGHVNYAIMAVLVALDWPQIFLMFVTAVTYSSLAIKIYSARHRVAGSP